MSALALVLSLTMLVQVVRASVPYVLSAMCGVWSERAGVVNIALEGILLSGALAAVAAQHACAGAVPSVVSALAGLAGAMLIGMLLMMAHALIVVVGRVDAIVSGLALNLIAAGATRFVLRGLYDSAANSPAVRGFSDVTRADPMTILALVATAWTGWTLYRTPFGLRARACGENPDAAASAGVNVTRVRTLALVVGGALCGLGGAALAYDQHQFQSGMSGGRGFIALAAVIVSGWRPWRAALACLLFAFLEALEVVLQDTSLIPREVVQMLPYAATLFVLAAIGHRGGKAGATPAGLGKHVGV